MNTILNSALTLTYKQLSTFAGLDNFWQVFDTAFGTQYNRSGAEILRLQWLSGDFSQFALEILDSSILGGANGAYAGSNNKIYLSANFLATSTAEAISAVLLEEIGHFVDAKINLTDSAGDEGAIFAALVQGHSLNAQTLTNLRAENDYATITVNGKELIVEQATVSTTDLNTVNATQLVNTLLGSGITASNITFTGANVAGGLFSGGIGAGIGIENGIILSSGNIASTQGPNNSGSKSSNNNQPGDNNLNTIIAPLVTYDAAVLEFDFIASTTTVSFSYVFASEEYYEYVNTSFNDAFAFYLNGQNIAIIPGTTTPVSINTVNAGQSSTPLSGTNSSFFIPNYGTTFNTQFDGFTTILSATATGLVPGVSNRIKLVIADAGDRVFDSAVFIQAASFGSSTIVTVTATDSDAGEDITPNTGEFTITRTGSTTNSLTINYTISGTASGTDYNSIASTVIIPAGQASTTVTVTPVNDTLIEGNETVILSLVDTASYDLGSPNTATVIIADNEAQNTIINLAVAPASVVENGATNLVYTFTRQGATTSPLTVNYDVGGSATFNSDYTQTGADSFSSTKGTITFATGVSTATLTIVPTGDTILENNETVALTLASGTNYTIGTATTIISTIIDDDTPVITLSLAPITVAEDGTGNLVYTFTRSGNTSTALTVNYGVSSTATLNTDYVQTGAATFTSTAGSITFAAGASTATLTIDPTADTTVEPDETVALTLASGAGYAISTTTTVAGTITNDDLSSGQPTTAWTRLLGSSSSDYGLAVTTGSDGSIYLRGYTAGDLDGQTNNSKRDVFITKYQPDGTKAWTKLLGSNGYDFIGYIWSNALTTGSDGAIYVGGYTKGNMDGQIYGGDNGDAFISKYQSDGTKVWTRLLGANNYNGSKALTTGNDGSIYVSGTTYGNLDGQTNNIDNTFITKYNPNGTKVWTRLLGSIGWSLYGYALTTGSDGSIYASGSTTGTQDGQTYNGGNYDAFITKYNPDGTKVWTRLLGSSSFESASALTTGSDGSIYVSGYTGGNLDGQTYNGGDSDAFITKYNPDGTKVWTKLLGTSGRDEANTLSTGGDGSIYVSGYTTGNLDGQTNSGDLDAFITKYNADGTKVWTKLLGSRGYDEAHDMTTDSNGSIYIAGYAEGSLDGQTYSGNGDAFITKLIVNNSTFTGTSNADTLIGTTGADTLIGLACNDTYTVNHVGDIVTEALNAGTDLVQASIFYTLPDNVENLTLTGTTNVNGAGNSLNNVLTGNSGNNTLTGGTGSDIFVFQFGQSPVSGADRITDVAIGTDKIDLLTSLGVAMNAPTAFTRAANSTATNLTNVVNSVFTDANGALTGNQALGVNSAALVEVTTASIAGTYLVINDGVAGFQSSNDLLVNITGSSGTLPALGTIAVSSFFI